jgi:hypothetical protein
MLTEWHFTNGGISNECVKEMTAYLTTLGYCAFHLDNRKYQVGQQAGNIMWKRSKVAPQGMKLNATIC